MKNVYAFSHKSVYCFNPVEWSKNWLEGWWKVETHFGQVPIFVSFTPRNLWNMLQLLIINQIFAFLNWMKNVGRVMIWVFGRRVDRRKMIVRWRTRRLAEIEHSQNQFWCNCALFRLFNDFYQTLLKLASSPLVHESSQQCSDREEPLKFLTQTIAHTWYLSIFRHHRTI